MLSLQDKFDELRLRLGHGRQLDSIGSEPIFYLVFPVRELIDVKRQTKAWIARLENDGWRVVTLSMTDAVEGFLRSHPLRRFWLMEEKQLLARSEKDRVPFDPLPIKRTVAKALADNSQLASGFVAHIDAKLAEAEQHTHGLLLITDLEALHPYLRINTIEAHLQGRVRCPVIVLYPGKREGKTSLKFLEFYPADPNYRSEHIG